MKIGVAGSIESNDVLVTVKESDHLSITIESIVYDFFKDEIEKVVKDALNEANITNVAVKLQDKGALNYTIRARLLTALERMK